MSRFYSENTGHFVLWTFPNLSFTVITVTQTTDFVISFHNDYVKIQLSTFLIRKYSNFKCWHKLCLRGLDVEIILKAKCPRLVRLCKGSKVPSMLRNCDPRGNSAADSSSLPCKASTYISSRKHR